MRNMKLAVKISSIVIIILTLGLIILWQAINARVSSLMKEEILKEMNDAVETRSEIAEQYVRSAEAYIIGYGNKTAGYAVCCMSASQEACGRVLWLDELYIKPEFRGNGLGKAFFEFIENSDEYGYVRLEVEHDNKRALKLYQSLGYADANYLSLYKKTKAE